MGLLLIACDLRRAGLTADDLLLYGLRRFCGRDTLPAIARASGGKPFFPQCPEIHFNLSHSGPFLLLGLADTPVGVDIEVVRPRRPSLPRFALTQEEYALFCQNGGGWKEFYLLWTVKEAYCKYTGDGLSRPSRLVVPDDIPRKPFSDGTFCAAAVCDSLERGSQLCWISPTPDGGAGIEDKISRACPQIRQTKPNGPGSSAASGRTLK
ncbi:MAG: 4-phosphopantetheinyl transferase [Oscillospiraceae bacterium]|nr:4-phosphopantetheinyl transferase [Oscillospiraceae bacterium]